MIQKYPVEFQGAYQTEGAIQKKFSSGEKMILKTGCQELANGSDVFTGK